MKLIAVTLLTILISTHITKETKVIEEKFYQIQLPEVLITSTLTLEDKWNLFRKLGTELPITITPEKFADCCIQVYWCESNLDPKAVNNGQVGFFQMTRETRKRLHLPIVHTFHEQLHQLKMYLLATKKIHRVKNSIDLHVLNFSPARFGQRVLSRAVGGLDFNQDGIITRQDLAIFQNKKRCKLKRQQS